MDQIESVCVFCGSRSGEAVHERLAEELGRNMAERGLGLVYGGGSIGLMGILARQVKASGGRVTGVIPVHLDDIEVAFRDADKLHVVEDMYIRKRLMFDLADAFIALPGGLGTLDEVLDVVTMAQLGMHRKPIAVLNHDGFWEPVFAVIDHMSASGFVSPAARRLFAVVPTVEQLLPALEERARGLKDAG